MKLRKMSVLLLLFFCFFACSAYAKSYEEYVSEAGRLYSENEYEKAVKSIDKAIAKQPLDANLHYVKGIALRYLGKNEEADKEFDKVLEKTKHMSGSEKKEEVATASMKILEQMDNKEIIADIYALKGHFSAEQRKFKEALKFYEMALAADYNFLAIHTYIGGSLLVLERNEEALEIFEKAIESGNMSLANNNKGKSLFEQGRTEEAFEIFKKTKEMNAPVELYKNSKMLSFRSVETKVIVDSIRYIIDRDTKYVADAYNNKGKILFAQGRKEEALEMFEKAISLASVSEAYANKGKILIEQGKEEEGLEMIEKAISAGPAADAYVYKGDILLGLGKNKEAVKAYDEAIRQNSRLVQPYLSKGLALAKTGKYEEGIKECDNAIRQQPDLSEAYLYKGLLFYEQGKYREALKSFDKVLEMNPDSYYSNIMKAYSLASLGKYEEAICECDIAINLKGNDSTLFLYKGNILAIIGKNEEALEFVGKAIMYNPDDPAICFVKGHALANMGKYEESLQELDKALKLNYYLGNMYFLRAYTFFVAERYEEALAEYDVALENKKLTSYINSEILEAFVCENKAAVFNRTGRYAESLSLLERAFALKPYEGIFYYTLAETHLLLGDMKKALESLEKYMKSVDVCYILKEDYEMWTKVLDSYSGKDKKTAEKIRKILNEKFKQRNR